MAAVTIETRDGPVEAWIAGDGPALLSLHGSPGGSGQALTLAAHFAGAGMRVLAPARPGYGRTPLSDHGSFECQADLMAALLDSLGVERAAVYAISGAGPIALELALRHLDRVAAIVLGNGVT